MSVTKYFLGGIFVVFAGVGLVGYLKRVPSQQKTLDTIVQEVAIPSQETYQTALHLAVPEAFSSPISEVSSEDLPDADRIHRLFATNATKLPIVETIAYTSRAPWIQGRPAWIADYASYYNTSRHFIARSLNRKVDYLSQKVSLGDRFNVFKRDKNLRFHLLVDLSRCRIWFYYIDLDQNERVLLKTYPVGIGRIDPKKNSGFLTPLGVYVLGDKIAIYKPGTVGFFQDEKVEMVRVFGTRWIPFDQEVADCTEPAKGLGLHGAPWVEDPETHLLKEDRSTVGTAGSDGCLRLLSEDIEEIFAIVITKPTTIELVKDFHEAKLPGVERDL